MDAIRCSAKVEPGESEFLLELGADRGGLQKPVLQGQTRKNATPPGMRFTELSSRVYDL